MKYKVYTTITRPLQLTSLSTTTQFCKQCIYNNDITLTVQGVKYCVQATMNPYQFPILRQTLICKGKRDTQFGLD